MSKDRLTTFIDAVMAIIMTILVLDLKQPNPVSLAGFWNLRQNFFAYSLSFFWLGAMWINFHNNWYYFKRITKESVWLTIIMLFFSSLFPYATIMVASNYYNSIAQSFYGLIVLMITLFNRLTYKNLKKFNFNKNGAVIKKVGKYNFFRLDATIKIIGLILSIFVYAPSTMLSILFTLIFLVIPNQIIQIKYENVN